MLNKIFLLLTGASAGSIPPLIHYNWQWLSDNFVEIIIAMFFTAFLAFTVHCHAVDQGYD